MSGGETSLSGYDNASQALSYTPGQEQVYLNGILLVRGDDYTATNGTSITGLTALAASDFVQINCYNNYSVATTPATSITGTIANNQLANSGITINSTAVALGGTITGLANSADVIAKTLTTTTGDIIYASGANTPARLGIGSTGQLLGVSGGVPAWTAAPSPTYVGASVYKATTQSCNNGSDNIITWDAEYYDTHNIHDNTTNNSRLYVPTGYGGKWLINFQHCWAAASTGAKWGYIYKNGVDVFGTFWTYTSAGSQVTHSASFVLQLAAGDYIDSRCGQNSGGALNLASGYSTQLQFSYLGA
jgi:hypothetical protein